jgi:hypothetical protein
MLWVLKILHARLTEERKWLRLEGLGNHDVKYKHGARMAKERIPQLEAAIKILGDQCAANDLVDVRRNDGAGTQAPKSELAPVVVSDHRPGKGKHQLNLFDSTLIPKSK